MKPRPLAAVAVVLSLLAACLFAARWQRAETKLRETRRWTHFVMDSLGTTLSLPTPPEGPQGRDSIYWLWVVTSAQMQSRRWQQAVRHWVETRATLLDEGDIFELKRQGLVDPVRQLRDSLVTHAELISDKPGVLGGKMFIVPGESIVLLESPYVFAQYDDGHIGGSMLLEYSILPGPRIEWKRLWARRE